MRDAHNSLVTDKPVALGFLIELDLRSVGFCQGKKKLQFYSSKIQHGIFGEFDLILGNVGGFHFKSQGFFFFFWGGGGGAGSNLRPSP